ncbi:MAG: ClpXP protease specificity-enhancing factor [Halopseudomonas sp.]|uniref:ClpXP protease specificity-enhancing factor n=1 Tax=Halopseudomonas sp. TaxID=2901191 RepID=UPI00300315FE
MTSSRPYLIRALYDWILDNQCTPYLLVNAGFPQTAVPEGFVEDGQIVLNLSPSAVRQLDMDNDRICFDGRFGGVPQQVWIPAGAVMAIYARENGQGMVFEIEPVTPPPSDGEGDTAGKGAAARPASKPDSGRPALKVVK